MIASVGTALAAVVLLLCVALAGLSAYLIAAKNSNTEIRPKLIGSALLAIFGMIAVGMVLIIMGVPAGSSLNAVGLVAVALAVVVAKFGRK